MNEVLIVGAAPAPASEEFYRSLLTAAAAVVAADGAGEWCVLMGRVPDLVVGDFDSAHEGAQRRLEALGATVRCHPTDKDLTDLELAVDAAIERWDLPLCLTAAFTGRMDHTLAALGLLTRAGESARVAEPGWRAWACGPGKPLHIDLPDGATFSVIATEPSRGVDVTGARWELHDRELDTFSGHGVSNEASSGRTVVSVEQGSLIVLAVDDVSA